MISKPKTTAAPTRTPRRSQGGFIVAYVLAGIALASVAIAGIARLNSANNTSERMATLRSDLVRQAELIRNMVVACKIKHPTGNNGTGFRVSFPGTPASQNVADLVCPGAPAGYQSLWNGRDAIVPPSPLVGMGPWKYVNDATSIRISIAVTEAVAFRTAALNSAALKFGSQASVTGSTLTITLAN